MSPARRAGLRALFAAVALSLPLMIVARERVGEPYPGLYQPAFDTISMRGDFFERDEAVLTFRDATGERHRVEVADLVRAPRAEEGFRVSVTRSLLRNRARMRAPEAVTYLRLRATELGILDPVRLQVTWYATTRSPRDRDGATRGDVRQAYTVRLAP